MAIERFLARTSDIRVDEAHHGPPGHRRWEFEPIYILTGFTDFVPETMPDGLPGYVASFNTIGRLSRACWEMVGRS